MKARALVVFATLVASAATAWAHGFIVVPRPSPWPRPMPLPHPVVAPLELVHHSVEVAIDDQKATTRVEQEFANPNGMTLEGEYIFPVPRGAHIDKFTMRVGDRDLEAELLDAGRARAIYEDIVRRQRDPALLEYSGSGAFRVRIFPIEPHGRKRVQITYTELLRQDGGLVTYTYPFRSEALSPRPLKSSSVKIHLEQSAPIKALYSPSHAIGVRREGERQATITWDSADTRPDTTFQLLFSTAASDVGLSLITQRTTTEDGTFLLLAAPGTRDPKSEEKSHPKDVVFVVDTSGSMAGKKLAQAKKALTFCVENLNESDRFEIVRFSTETEACFEKLISVTPEQRVRAQDWIGDLRPIGGTAIQDALRHALRLRPANSDRPFVVIFLTDGQPTVGETREDRIISSLSLEARGAMTRVFCFGIGSDVNTHLLDKIAEATRGASQYVLPEEDLEVKVSSFFTKIRDPLLTDLKITWPDGVRVAAAYPYPLPDLFRGDQLVVAGKFSGAGEGDLVIEGLVNGRPQRIVQRVRFTERATGREFIPQLWATRRVGWLLDEVRLRGDNPELRDEIVQLARRHAIVTPYTSYLIVEDEARRAVPMPLRSLPGIDRDAQAMEILRSGYTHFRHEKSGDIGTRNARASSSLKDAERADSAISRNAYEVGQALASAPDGYGPGPSGPGVGAARAPSATPTPGAAAAIRKIASSPRSARVVAGKTFFQNGRQWTDTDTQQRKRGNAVRVQFATDAYFQLLAQHPETAPWLALGASVQFTLGDTFYEVTE